MEYKYEIAYKVSFIVRFDDGKEATHAMVHYFKDRDKAIALAKKHDEDSVFVETIKWYTRTNLKDLEWFEFDKDEAMSFMPFEFVSGYKDKKGGVLVKAVVDKIIITL